MTGGTKTKEPYIERLTLKLRSGGEWHIPYSWEQLTVDSYADMDFRFGEGLLKRNEDGKIVVFGGTRKLMRLSDSYSLTLFNDANRVLATKGYREELDSITIGIID